MSELRSIARHAGTVLAGQLAVMAYGVTDTLVAGRHSPEALAALAVGSAFYISVYIGLMGVLQALLPIWAELLGAGRPQALGASVRQSLYLSAVAALLGMGLLLWPEPALAWTQVPAELRPDVTRYLGLLAWALPPALLFRLYSTLSQALHQPRLVTWLQLGGLAIKVPLSMLLTWGGAGWPAQGAAGCALATLVVNYSLLGLAWLMLRRQTAYQALQLWRPLERPDPAQLGQFLRLGLPAGLSVMVEVTSFTLMALFISRLGTTAAASHQIAANVTAVLYMVPLSLAIATSARTSYWLGAGEPERAKRSVLTGLMLALGLGVVASTALWLGHEQLPRAYAESPEVARQAAPLLLWVAFFHLADAWQTLCVFVLRCYRVTLSPLLVYSVLLWGAGLGGGYLLAYQGLADQPAWASATAFWAASTLALWLAALLLTPMLWFALRRPVTPPAP
ncbi:MATE family efflux transporter [Curvibacter sp. HBC61]|uniref:MATE family efflux transporter n=1 Tax=Curvibacter cyanobacteriorum TaxID=3026422 RepID=A0ABT5MV74_9BURK|nr:MATE family efflux transporter [Curvibacter sp. HBC61]MDD0837800.1 MATE family efflux transporter [Curvibacter sp. HBC61]